MVLHPDCAALEPFLGTWQGEGRGDYPTIERFAYSETLVIDHVGKPFVSFDQRTKFVDSGLPLHAEYGYIRALGGSSIEFVVAIPSGIAELHAGTVNDGLIELASTSIARTDTAKVVTEVRRRIVVDGDRLHYVLDMAAVDQDLQFHLEAELHRV
ncbi:MAG: FABP family protein [Acidobacteria bacterium]|nr:FABP family protein [Acidobacteriota bacterium]